MPPKISESDPGNSGSYGTVILGRDLVGDVAAAMVSSAFVTPAVVLLDRALVEKSSFNQPIIEGLRRHSTHYFKKPVSFIFSRPFGIVWVLCAATFGTANATETVASTLNSTSMSSFSSVPISLVNVPIGIWKDLKLAQIYSSQTTKGAKVRQVVQGISRASMTAFLIRDSAAMFGSFTLPTMLASAVPDSVFTSAHGKIMATQATVPILSQFVSTPVHLLGLDYYNRNGGATLMERLSRIRADIMPATIASNLSCHFEKERPPSSDGETPTPGPVVCQSQALEGSEENITIDDHPTESILWPRFLSRLKQAFFVDSASRPEDHEVVVTQAQTGHNNRLSENEYARLKSVVDSFPPRPVADFLVSVCIRHGVDIFFYFDQAQIMDEIAQFYTNGASPLRTDPSFICLALGLFALGSNWTPLERPIDSPLPNGDDSDLGRVFFKQAKLLIPDVIERTDLKAIQACFLLGIYLMPLNAPGSSYVYMGIALRKALAFDLHQSPDDQTIDDREKEIRCRLWWSIYSLERCTTLKLNRPRSVPASVIGIPLPSPMPSLDMDQKFENLELQIAYARLMLILDGYSDSTWITNSSAPADSNKIQAELRHWKRSLPEEFDLEDTDPRDSRYRAIFHLYLNYYYAWIVIGKASLIMRLFEKLVQSGNSARFSFTDFQGCSIATIITLIAGIVQRDSTHDTRVNFGLQCLRQMADGNPAATIGVKFVETLQSISEDSAQKLRASGTFRDTQEREEATSPSAYNHWAEWLAAQNQGDSVPTMETTSGNIPVGGTPSLWPVSISLGETWSQEAHTGLEASSAARPSISLPIGASGLDIAGNDHLSTLYHDGQNFLMGLTGLDVLDFAGAQLSGLAFKS
ncbi:transcriptional regulatory [Fusarium mexicanum]|uniref:Transcriptional regulatory n=1 Tax=Fusarium mexicanum TaxID=751941 RepID=A0A8H5MPG4_9HYPO|nr:transcriptional regulatory [Fusarium mexicanum]